MSEILSLKEKIKALEALLENRKHELQSINRNLQAEVCVREQVEIAHEENRQMLFNLMNNLPGMIYRRRNDPEQTAIFISEGANSLTGYSVAELSESPRRSYQQMILPHDYQRVFDNIQNALEQKKLFQEIYRIKLANRQIKWVMERGRGIYSNQGTLLQIDSFIIDVTQQKLAEEKLKEYTQNLETANTEMKSELKRLQKTVTQWHALPVEIQSALEDILFKFVSGKNYLDDELKETLLRITSSYGANLSQFIKMNQECDPEIINKRNKWVQLLKKIPLFQEINAFDLIAMTEKMEEMKVAPDTLLLIQNQEAEGVFFIENGEVEILVNEELVAHRKTGESIGEMSCLRGEANASATVRTSVSSLILKIARKPFMEVVNRLPKLWQYVFRDMTNRFNETSLRLSELYQHSLYGLAKLDPLGCISNEYSTKCIEYLGTRTLTGKPLELLLFPENPEIQNGWRQIYPVLFEESFMDFEDLAEALPKEALLAHNGLRHEYGLSYYPCKNPSQKLIAVDIGIKDITKEKELVRERTALEIEKAIVQKIYDDPDSFLQLLQLARDTLVSLDTFVQTCGTITSPGNLKEMTVELMRELHTLKGISGLFLLEDIKLTTHLLEDELRKLNNRTHPDGFDPKQFQMKKRKLEEHYHFALAMMDNIDENQRRRLLGVVFSQDEFKELKALLQKGLMAEVQNFIIKIEKVPARRLVHQWPQEIKRLGQLLKKDVKFKLTGDNVLISKELFQQLEAVLIHIVRNCVDHGIEALAQRLEAGKEEWGRITVDIKEKKENLILEISDDGQGIDFQKLIQKAKNHPALDQKMVESCLSEDKPWKLLFLSGFSTAKAVTEVSGRGVGLDAVQKAISKVGGTIELLSELGKGTTFCFTIPLELQP
ncbi:ATP-binding protein [Deltaproteobacteria bacterium TL4]